MRPEWRNGTCFGGAAPISGACNSFGGFNARDNWYRGAQGVLVFSRPDNTSNYVGGETDFVWTHMFADGKVSLTATYGHFFVGEYVRNNLGTNKDQDWGMVQLWMNF